MNAQKCKLEGTGEVKKDKLLLGANEAFLELDGRARWTRLSSR